MDRRAFLASAGASASIAALFSSSVAKATLAPSKYLPWRIPGEFEPTRAVWLGYDDDPEFSAVSLRMAEALLPHAELVVVAQDGDKLAHARSAMSKAGLDEKRITFLYNEASRFFIRDFNVFSIAPRRLGVVDFQFNTYGLPGWCANHLYPGAPERAKRCAAFGDPVGGNLDRWIAQQRSAQMFSSSLFMEGGAIEVNGKGTLLVSEPLALQRNAESTRAELESQFLKLPGVRKVIWLAAGAAEDPHMKTTIVDDFIGFGAGSHTDEFVRFADPRTILLAWVDPPRRQLHPVEKINAERMKRNFTILSKASDQDGRPFRILKVPMPVPVTREIVLKEKAQDMETWTAGGFPASEGRKVGDRLTHVAASSYLNYIVANDLVLLPSYIQNGTPVALQERVAKIFRAAFPGRKISFIDVTRLNWAGGGIHCATCNEPAVG